MTEEHYEVEYVFGKRMDKEINYAVKWLGYDKKHHTWEPISSFSQASLLLICRFERFLAYRNYYKLILKKIEKVQQPKKLDEPIRIHIRNRYSQVFIKEQEIINIELETDELFTKNNNKVNILSFPDNSLKDKQNIVTSTNNINNNNNNNNNKNKFKIEKDYLNEIIFEQRQREKERELIIRDVSEAPKREIIFQVVNESIQTEIISSLQMIYRGQQFQYRVFNQKVQFELILSHNIIKNELWFKCLSEDQEILFADLSTLKNNYTTLLLDYLQSFAILL